VVKRGKAGKQGTKGERGGEGKGDEAPPIEVSGYATVLMSTILCVGLFL